MRISGSMFLRTLWVVLPVFGFTVDAGAQKIPFEHIVLDKQVFGHRSIGDIDGDGKNDVVVINKSATPHKLVWCQYPDWRKHTIRDFGDFSDYVHNRSCDMELGDIDGDGDLDVVLRLGVPDKNAPGVNCWFENPGPKKNRAAAPWARHDIGESNYIKDFGVVDMNGDGKLDVVAREHSKTIVYLQNSPTSWTRSRAISHVPKEGMAIGDLDADGDPDVVLNGFWLENGPWRQHEIDSKWWNQSSGKGIRDCCNVEVADLNQDGRTDVLLSHSEMPGYPVSWYEASDPKKGPWKEHKIAEVFDYCQTLQAADIDGDGDIDVLVGEFPRYDAPHPVVVFINQGKGLTWSRQELADTGIYHGVIGDVGSDGDIDVVGSRNYNEPPIEMWENKGKSSAGSGRLSLDKWTYIEVDDSRATRFFGLAMGDLTGDGKKDIVAGDYFYRNPGGNMTGKWSRVDLSPDRVDALLIVDVDGDSAGEVIGVKQSEVYRLQARDSQGNSWKSTKIGTWPGNDHNISSQGYELAQIIPGGRPEIVLNGSGLHYFRIPKNPQSGNWPLTTIASAASVSTGEGIGVGDIDRDGDVDLVAAHKVGRPRIQVCWYANPADGSGNWRRHELGVTKSSCDRVELVDLNGDGRLDVACGEETQSRKPGSGFVFWFEQPGDPESSKWPRHTIAAQYTTNSLDVADMDNDGDTDIITGEHRGTKKVAIWENDGKGNFTEHVVDEGKESHLGARVADMDGDGDLDILSIAWDNYQYLHLWRNDAR